MDCRGEQVLVMDGGLAWLCWRHRGKDGWRQSACPRSTGKLSQTGGTKAPWLTVSAGLVRAPVGDVHSALGTQRRRVWNSVLGCSHGGLLGGNGTLNYLMWFIYFLILYFFKKNISSFSLLFLFFGCALWDLNSPTRDRTGAPCTGSTEC